jgi:heat shock protein HslJ
MRLSFSLLVAALTLLSCKSNNVSTNPIDVSNPDGASPSLILVDIWALEAIDGKPIDEVTFNNHRPRLEFNSEGKVYGTTGCNDISGAYTTDGVKLSFGPMIATKMACPGNGERDFLAALRPVTTFRIENLKLYLLAGGKEKLQFRKID